MANEKLTLDAKDEDRVWRIALAQFSRTGGDLRRVFADALAQYAELQRALSADEYQDPENRMVYRKGSGKTWMVVEFTD